MHITADHERGETFVSFADADEEHDYYVQQANENGARQLRKLWGIVRVTPFYGRMVLVGDQADALFLKLIAECVSIGAPASAWDELFERPAPAATLQAALIDLCKAWGGKDARRFVAMISEMEAA